MSSGAGAVVTCVPLLDTALAAAKGAGIPEKNVFIVDLPGLEGKRDRRFASVEELISEGERLPELDVLRWAKGQGERQTAFLSYSSGTSGLPVRHTHPHILRTEKLTPPQESGHGLSPQRHRQCPPAHHV